MNYILTLVFAIICTSLFAQMIKIDRSDKDLTFTGTRAIKDDTEYDSTGQLVLSGYISSYYASYSDSIGYNDYVKIPTVAPRNNRLGIDLIQFGAKYSSERFRGIFTLQWGDIPQSSWSPDFNFIQEANLGVRIIPKLWLDVGFFRTHMGLESIQPRENIAASIASTTYYEPYFLSGAKLTYRFTDKFAVQANVFNSFNTFTENNRNKAVGFSAVLTPNDKLSLTFNTLTCDEKHDSVKTSKQRLYNNIFLVYKTEKFDFGAEYNFGFQLNSKLNDPTKTAFINSALLAFKYKAKSYLSLYVRAELYSDPDEILTGPVENSYHQLVGLDLLGETIGFEIKPIKNAYFRTEGRFLQLKKNEDIFRVNGKWVSHREELIAIIGVWF